MKQIRLTGACVIYCIYIFLTKFYYEKLIKPFLFERQPEILYILPNNGNSLKGSMCFSFS